MPLRLIHSILPALQGGCCVPPETLLFTAELSHKPTLVQITQTFYINFLLYNENPGLYMYPASLSFTNEIFTFVLLYQVATKRLKAFYFSMSSFLRVHFYSSSWILFHSVGPQRCTTFILTSSSITKTVPDDQEQNHFEGKNCS